MTNEPGLKGQNSSLIIWGLFGSHELFVICVENWILDKFALLSFYVKKHDWNFNYNYKNKDFEKNGITSQGKRSIFYPPFLFC